MPNPPDSKPAPSKTRSPLARILSGLKGDLRFAVRMLVKNKGFAAAALLTLALCIGANTAIFSMLYALVIKPLPYREPARIVEVYNSFPKVGLNKWPSNVVQYLDFQENTDAFAHLALWQPNEFTLGEEGGPSRLNGAFATAEIFDVLGVQPFLGRFFTAENHVSAASTVVVLTHSFWVANYQADPDVIGRTILFNGTSCEIIGVAPRLFEAFDARVKMVRPFAWQPDQVSQMSRYGVSPRLYGRLKPNTTIGAAYAQVAALEQQFYDAAPPPVRGFLDRSGHIIGVDTVQAQRTAPVRTALYLLQGGVLFVLLIGCVNVANLLLARSNARQGELAIRAALGAGRSVLARQLFIESALLTWLGAALGLGLAWAALGGANRFSAQLLPNALPFTIDGRVLGYTALIATVMSLVIGLLPIAQLLSGNLLRLMQSQSRGASTGRSARTMSSVLVVAQMAFALMLLTGAGLLIRSFAQATAVSPGFTPEQLITARVALPGEYREGTRIPDLHQRLLTELERIPGVQVTLASATPFQTGLPLNAFTLRDYPLAEGTAQPGAFHLSAAPSYLETLRIPLLEGRWFNESDTQETRRVFVVDQDFAERFFPDGGAVGANITFGGPPENADDWPEIIGVVGNVRHNGVEESSGNPFLYHPMKQSPPMEFSILVRTPRPVPEVLRLVRETVAAIDPALPVFGTGPMESVIDTRLNNRRGIMLLLAAFAGIALLLSAIGIYGVLAYDVAQRVREIGIRGALGATREQVTTLILWQGMWKTGAGLAIGIAGALLLSRYMTSLLYALKPTDPLAYAAVSLLLLVVALLASYLPARRAARIDPIVALRDE